MELVLSDGVKKFPDLKEHCYGVLQDNGLCRYWNVRLLRRDQTVEYKGVTHECILIDPPPHALFDVWYNDHETGANRDVKYRRDAALLTWALRQEPENSRYIFYMAQSLAGLEMWERAKEFCDMRAKMGGLEEERWWAQMQSVRFAARLDRPKEEVISGYLLAFQSRPTRAEPLLELAKYCDMNGDDHVGMIFVNPAGIALFGFNPTDLSEINARQVYAEPAAREQMVHAIAPQGFVQDYPLRMRRNDGTELEAVITSSAWQDSETE